ncbi:ubiquitin-conjugating enzyme/RWD-like protein [Sphaerosporella brunnea]|uniref:Ubiquitin-conjugating enzyme/RWD-like protein n=1 Tax=Sphaerosporella brunnea TaxID=1250544 RepID=A0A5J5F3L9_9PEZI|nr:ubiquitin-conjugating enzyme/RWD-like protein [Sphaerosporella brunnea]
MSVDERKIAERMLMLELKEIQKENWVNAEAQNGNLFLLNPTSLYHGAYLKVPQIPKDYPMSPPEFRFLRPLFHPNIYKTESYPGEDECRASLLRFERWSAAQRIFTVLISILSLLDDAEVSSAANVDASRIVKENVETSKRDIPAGFQMPTSMDNKPPPKEEEDDDFWCDSGDSDFGADSDEDMIFGRVFSACGSRWQAAD